MTKKERAEVDALRQEFDRYRALRWTEPVKPDIPVPSSHEETVGWTFNAWGKTVTYTWSTSAAHGALTDNGRKIGSGSQGGVALYSTEVKALAALRHAVERESAWTLGKIDLQIAAARQRTS